jgi:hypothetical protein
MNVANFLFKKGTRTELFGLYYLFPVNFFVGKEIEMNINE